MKVNLNKMDKKIIFSDSVFISEINDDKLENKILDALDEIRPFLLKDGGDISLESIKNSTVKVKLHGACADCKVNQMTLKNGVETTIKKYAPEIKEVKSVLPLSQ